MAPRPLPPELWGIVASHLRVHDATQLRLVSRFFADVAGAHIIPDVSFYLHQDDIARLRGISSKGVLARSVRSLVYFTDLYKRPLWTFGEFRQSHQDKFQRQELYGCRSSRSGSEVKLADDSTLLAEYEKYKHLVAVQGQMQVDMADLACLRDAFAKFTGLRHVTMSHGNLFLPRPWHKPRTPFKTPFELPTYWPQPAGVRQLEVLLEALAHNKTKLRSLRAGIVEWVFFDKTKTELERLFRPAFDAVEVELEIGLDLDGLQDVDGDTEMYRKLMERGVVGSLLARMKRLELLRVGFQCDMEKVLKPAMLKNIMVPSHHWPHLRRLELSNIETDRHALMQLLSLHKDTLRFLCLEGISLGDTSWEKLLPAIRNNLDLDDACICGILMGHKEDMPGKGSVELWEWYTAETCEDDMRASINLYCRNGGSNYPDELPLTEEVVRKNFDEYVRRYVEQTQAEWEEQNLS